MPTRAWTFETAKLFIEGFEEVIKEGFAPSGYGMPEEWRAIDEYAKRIGKSPKTVSYNLLLFKDKFNLSYDETLYNFLESPAPKNKYQNLKEKIKGLIKVPRTISDIQNITKAELNDILDILDELSDEGFNVHRNNDVVEIPSMPKQSWTQGHVLEILSNPDNTYAFGATGDWHVGSKYFRQDVLTDLYQRFYKAGVTDVFNTGNWIDGEARFNKYDLTVHGLDAQCRALSEALPFYAGMKTHAVWGDDHEGWYAQREGIDVGKYAENVMRKMGRADWNDLGFMEAHVILRNVNSGVGTMMSVIHPGGGSSYATSYRPQKIIESMEGGEKPAIVLMGHYHKMEQINIRNVWVHQSGATQDQTPFLRKKSIEVHIGGGIIRCEQDPKTGAIIEFNGMIRYFNRGFYTGSRWSHHANVKPMDRSPGGI